MKKQIVSTLLALCMLLCLMPTAAFAEESTETPPVCSCETACTAESMNTECPVCGAENAIPQNCGQYIPVEERIGENSSTEGADDPNGPTELSAADQVQAMINALPSAEAITEENAEEVKAQLEAIDEAKAQLSDEEIDELDMTRYAEAAAALGALAAPMLLANDSPDEQFSLTPGGRYYFDLSAMNIPGTVNGGLPDTTLHYVPFTYAGTIEAYKLTSAMATTEVYAQQNKYAHSLFVADYAVTHAVSWNGLNDEGLIFGKNYASGGVDYTLRAPSVGSDATGLGDSDPGVPQSNEWDTMLNKDSGYIQNWNNMYSWGQDVSSDDALRRAVRGYGSARHWLHSYATSSHSNHGFRPVLEVRNPNTLDPDGLKAVTLDLGGGTLGGSSDAIQIIVKNGSEFTAPASGGLTRPDGNTGSYFMWLGSDGKRYAPGASVPADVTKLTAQFALSEQFTLKPGGRYYFDLSGEKIPGTANGNLPDSTLHYVPFTYAGTIEAYKLTSAMATTEVYAQQNKYAHSLFVADYAVTHAVSWNGLNDEGLIFGKNYASGGVDYTLRAPSVGSNSTGLGDSRRGVPQSNEWDAVLNKNSGYIQNWNKMYLWGQDVSSVDASYRARRGYSSARNWYSNSATGSNPSLGFRPVLEVLNAETLGSDGLKVVTLDLGGGTLGGSSDAIQIIVKNGSEFTAPASGGLTRPDGNTGSYFMWLGSDGKRYAPGASVPADVTKLTAQFALSEQFTLTPGGRYYFDLSAMNIPGTANRDLPDSTLHYVPFTYVGTVNAYSLENEADKDTTSYEHSLFIANYNVTHTVSWDALNTAGLIFGKDYAAGGVDYTLRAPSVGSNSTGSGDSERGVPQSNEWDTMLNKDSGYIQNWNGMYSWGQDAFSGGASYRAVRGCDSARYWISVNAAYSNPSVGFRPVLEVLNADTLGPDGLKVVTLDLGGGTLGGSSDAIQIIVKNGSEFTAPASDGLNRPAGDTGSYFMWLGSNGKLYAPGASVPADVTKLTAQFALSEQFTLTPGGRYYFDLSAMGIPGTVNGGLPDTKLHYVPFTYAGTIEAYKLMSATATTEEYARKNKYAHSLFVADYNVTHTVSWDDLNTKSLIFGKDYASGGVGYTLRAPSVGSDSTGWDDSQRGTPTNNEWDTILDKDNGYIQNWNKIISWGQDTYSTSIPAVRGDHSARFWGYFPSSGRNVSLGFRPVLEVPNPGTLGADGLKAVTLNLGGGKLGGSSDAIHIIVKNGSAFTAPASGGLTRPAGDTGSYFMWLDSNGNSYAPGASVPADVTELTVQWTAPTYTVTLNAGDGTINSGNVTEYTYGVGATLPTDVTRTGYTFKGWYDNENLTSSPVTAIGNTEKGDKVYWAKWEINQYTVTVKPENGEADITITQDYGTPISAPTLTREGYQFNGWDKAFPTTMPAEDMTITAQWKDSKKPTGEIKAETATPQPTVTPQPTQTAQPQPTVQPVSPIPRTGDAANPALWFALLIVSGSALAAIFVLRRKANRK